MGLSEPSLRWTWSLPFRQARVAWKREILASQGQAQSLSGDLRPSLIGCAVSGYFQWNRGSGPSANSSGMSSGLLAAERPHAAGAGSGDLRLPHIIAVVRRGGTESA